MFHRNITKHIFAGKFIYLTFKWCNSICFIVTIYFNSFVLNLIIKIIINFANQYVTSWMHTCIDMEIDQSLILPQHCRYSQFRINIDCCMMTDGYSQSSACSKIQMRNRDQKPFATLRSGSMSPDSALRKCRPPMSI